MWQVSHTTFCTNTCLLFWQSLIFIKNSRKKFKKISRNFSHNQIPHRDRYRCESIIGRTLMIELNQYMLCQYRLNNLDRPKFTLFCNLLAAGGKSRIIKNIKKSLKKEKAHSDILLITGRGVLRKCKKKCFEKNVEKVYFLPFFRKFSNIFFKNWPMVITHDSPHSL